MNPCDLSESEMYDDFLENPTFTSLMEILIGDAGTFVSLLIVARSIVFVQDKYGAPWTQFHSIMCQRYIVRQRTLLPCSDVAFWLPDNRQYHDMDQVEKSWLRANNAACTIGRAWRQMLRGRWFAQYRSGMVLEQIFRFPNGKRLIPARGKWGRSQQ